MALIPNETIEEIKDKADIVSIIGCYIQLKRSGANFTAVCPFHKEKTPSFMVSPRKGIYHCFGCHVGGNVFKFVMEYEKLSFIESVRKVAQSIGFDMSKVALQSGHRPDKRDEYYRINDLTSKTFEQNLKNNEFAYSYFSSRNVDAPLMQKFRLGFSDASWDQITRQFEGQDQQQAVDLGLVIRKERQFDRFRNRIMFPIFDVNKHIVGFGGRRLNEEDNPKYLNSPDSSVYNKSYVLYGLSHALDAIRVEKSCIFVEGYMDVLRCHQYGIENVVATSGTALTVQHARLIKRYTQKVFLIFDSDDAGLNAMIRSIPTLLAQSLEVHIVPMPKGHDPDSLLLKFGDAKFAELLGLAVDYIDFQYRFYNKRGDFKQNTTKSVVIKQMIDHTNAIPDKFLQSLNKSRIGKLFGMDDQTIDSYKVQETHYDEDDSPENLLQQIFADVNQSKYHNERELCNVLFNLEGAALQELCNQLKPQYFKNSSLKRLVEDIHNVLDDVGELSLDALGEYDSTGFYAAFAAQASMKEYPHIEENSNDILHQLQLLEIDDQIARLKQADSIEALGQIAALQKEKQKLIAERI